MAALSVIPFYCRGCPEKDRLFNKASGFCERDSTCLRAYYLGADFACETLKQEGIAKISEEEYQDLMAAFSE